MDKMRLPEACFVWSGTGVCFTSELVRIEVCKTEGADEVQTPRPSPRSPHHSPLGHPVDSNSVKEQLWEIIDSNSELLKTIWQIQVQPVTHVGQAS